jgi:endoglucanase
MERRPTHNSPSPWSYGSHPLFVKLRMLHQSRFISLTCLALSMLVALGCASDPPPSGIGTVQPPAELPPPPVGSPVNTHGQLAVAGTLLVDQLGTPVQLKGVSSHWLNWASKPYAESETALAYMRDAWKLSVIRAAMGTEASAGYLSGGQQVMLEKVERIVQNAIRMGVYVLVDWHTEKAVDQLADAIAFFTYMAQRYGTYPNVIWEPYNEPRGYTWPQIRAYHEAVVDAIRVVDPDNLIVMGTPTWSQDVDVASLDPVAPTAGTSNLLYTLHFYACTHQLKFRDKADIALANGIALFVTEFGATHSDGGTPTHSYVCRAETDLWFDWMAQNNISGVAWKLDQCADTSCLLTGKAPLGGPWTDDVLTSDVGMPEIQPGMTEGGGHGLLIVDWIRQ